MWWADALEQVRVRGTASGLRRVCHARVRGVVVACDQARVLAAAIDAGPAPAAVAGLLFAPTVPYPLCGDSLWEGVEALAPDYQLTVDGAACVERPPAVWSAAHAARQLGRAMSDVELAVPYLDDQVVDAALTVDLAERGTPWRYKPLLADAVRPVAAGLPERATKASFTADGIAGLRRHRAELVALCDDLQLARLRLVDPEALRAAIVGLDPTGRILMAADHTLAAELWLREATGGRVAAA